MVERWQRAIAAWEIAGGALSGAWFFDALRRLPESHKKTIALSLAGALCTLSILSGIGIAKGVRFWSGASIFIQLVQALAVASKEFAFQIVLGPFAYVTLNADGLGVDIGFRPLLVIQNTHADSGPTIIGVNALALFFVLVLVHSLANSQSDKHNAA